jgi:hypothetical protein
MSGRAAVVVRLLLAAGCVGCGGTLQHGLAPDGAAGGGSTFDATAPTARPAACGGTVQAGGMTPHGTFDARYIVGRLGVGDCSAFGLTVAQTGLSDSDAFWLFASVQPDGSRLGTTTETATYSVPAGSLLETTNVSATVTITAFPTIDFTDLPDGGTDPVVGSFTVEGSGFSVTGTFSTPICAFNICV